MSEQKLREALERVAGMEDIEPCLACGSHHNLIRPEEDGDTSCYVREALSQPPTSDEGTPTETPLTDKNCVRGFEALYQTTKDEDEWVRAEISRLLETRLHAKERELAEARVEYEGWQKLAGSWKKLAKDLERQLAALPSGYVQVPRGQLEKVEAARKEIHQIIDAAPEDKQPWLMVTFLNVTTALWEVANRKYAATPTPSDSKPGEGT